MSDQSPERNAELAELLGWKWVAVIPIPIEHAMDISSDERYNRKAILLQPEIVAKCDPQWIWDDDPGCMRAEDGTRNVSKYGSSLDLMAGVEAEIAKRDLWYEYARHLMKIRRPDGDWTFLSGQRIAWVAATATATQKRDAAIAALKGAK